MKKVKKFGFGGALKAAGSAVKKAAAQVPAKPGSMGQLMAAKQAISTGKQVGTAQTSKPGTPPPTVMPEGVNPNFKTAIASTPKYTGPGAGPTGPANMAKINQVKGMLQGKPMKKGGEVKHSDVKMDKKVVKKAVGMHEKQLHGGKKSDMSKLKSGGMACAPKKMAKGGGIEVRGKTKGTMVKMKRGGSC